MARIADVRPSCRRHELTPSPLFVEVRDGDRLLVGDRLERGAARAGGLKELEMLRPGRGRAKLASPSRSQHDQAGAPDEREQAKLR